MIRGILTLLATVLVGGVCALYLLGSGWLGEHWGGGVVTNTPVPDEVIAERRAAQRSGAAGIGAPQDKQILFGDLHVHTTYSFDAFVVSMPLNQGEGAHPPADACDFARFCSSIDFWSINDHAIVHTPENWQETVDSIRQCNAVAGDPANPDLVSFLGWEWTQIGATPEGHYGHKNVVLLHTDDERIPARPIAAGVPDLSGDDPGFSTLTLGLLPLVGRDPAYLDMTTYLQERAAVPTCPDGVPVRDLPRDCREFAPTPRDLFAKLDEWGHEALVIPHGTTWGFYTPMGSSWDKQLTRAMHDPARQTLIEVFSGHGNSEEYRDWREILSDGRGGSSCPEPGPSYLPSCWRAGEIVYARCIAAEEEPAECFRRADDARRNYLAGDVSGYLTVPGSTSEEWLDAGQCSDCFQPAFRYRPRNSVQYIVALSSFARGGEPQRFRFGFMAASDNHSARPGTGYKEYGRWYTTEAGFGTMAAGVFSFGTEEPEPIPESVPFDSEGAGFFNVRETERSASFFVTGGLTAAHARGRSRDAIWQALKRKEVYGTSGPRILLWFDLTNGERRPMGSELRLAENPAFEVRAVGSFEQRPGCPAHAANALAPERLERLCRGECYHPSDQRRLITRIEVVRIRPQIEAGEPVGSLIEDPWRVFPCPADSSGCRVQFEDLDFVADGRDALYYVRAIEAPSPAVNAQNLRCDRDAQGLCIGVHTCEHTNTPPDDDCLATTEQRAWSSPIFVDYERP